MVNRTAFKEMVGKFQLGTDSGGLEAALGPKFIGVAPAIKSLYFNGSKSTVLRVIGSIVVYAVDLKLRLESIRFCPINKCLSIIPPFLAHRDSAPTIIMIISVIWIITTSNHG